MKNRKQTLIYTALRSEAQALIEKLKMKRSAESANIFRRGDLLLLIGGVGGEATRRALEGIFEGHRFGKAFNIGIAGCGRSDVPVGTLFVCNRRLEGLERMEIESVDAPRLEGSDRREILYDMEAEYFMDVVSKYIDEKHIYVFKVVSDHLDGFDLSKDQVKNLIAKSVEQWRKYL